MDFLLQEGIGWIALIQALGGFWITGGAPGLFFRFKLADESKM